MARDELLLKVCRAIGLQEIIGKKWSLLILKNLATNSPLHFNEIKRLLSGISNKVLSERLQQLEREQLIVKISREDKSDSNLYTLTPLALELDELLQKIDSWIERWEIDKVKTRKNILDKKSKTL